MKRAWVEFRPAVGESYVAGHRAADDERRPLPPEQWVPPVRPVPGKGYPRFFVEVDGFTFEFISVYEMETCAAVLDQRLVSREQSQERWYRKLPAHAKAANYRHRAARYMREVAAAYERQLTSIVAAPSTVPARPRSGNRAAIFRMDLRT